MVLSPLPGLCRGSPVFPPWLAPGATFCRRSAAKGRSKIQIETLPYPALRLTWARYVATIVGPPPARGAVGVRCRSLEIPSPAHPREDLAPSSKNVGVRVEKPKLRAQPPGWPRKPKNKGDSGDIYQNKRTRENGVLQIEPDGKSSTRQARYV